MKNKVLRLSLLCVVAIFYLFNTSCLHKNTYSAQTRAMDSISVLLNKADSVFNKVDTTHIKNCISHIFIVLEDVKMNDKDTVSPGASDILRSFNQVRWELQKYQGRQGVIRYEIKRSVDQLGRLSHDMKNNLIKPDSAMDFYGFEMKKARELIEATNLGMKTINTQLPLYDLIVPQADSLDNRVKNHQKI